MRITDISIQVKNPDRVNVSVDGKYRFSLDISQVTELGIKKERDYTEDEIVEFETESQFGKLYARALEYTFMRPHSAKEIRDYLWRKTKSSRYRDRKTQEIREREGVSAALTERVYNRLVEKKHIDDEAFSRYWVENRQLRKGISDRKLVNELRLKGVDTSIIYAVMNQSPRDENEEIMKVITKKRMKYPDETKLIAYLMRQGFSYDLIKSALSHEQQD